MLLRQHTWENCQKQQSTLIMFLPLQWGNGVWITITYEPDPDLLKNVRQDKNHNAVIVDYKQNKDVFSKHLKTCSLFGVEGHDPKSID